ncbi:MAG: hypothetical protein CSYNP_02814 [Syntrophus sp. SKADARSKE-3]|nr:hypothetical protein [Syntrophus sp. SKADARSKE-3]
MDDANAKQDSVYQEIFNNAPIGMIYFDQDGRVLQCNNAYLGIVGAVPETLFSFLGSLQAEENFADVVDRFIRDSKSVSFECDSFSAFQDKLISIKLTLSPLVQNGTISGGCGIIEDVTERKKAQLELRQTNETLATRQADLERINKEMQLLSKSAELLHTCRTMDEAYQVICRCAYDLFPGTRGVLFLADGNNVMLEPVASWARELADWDTLGTDECWALRRGRIHSSDSGLPCAHTANQHISSVCVPLVASGIIRGLLHIVDNNKELVFTNASRERLSMNFADQVNLALTNIKMQETMHNLSIREPLTGLYNRRYVEEMVSRELVRLRRRGGKIGLIILDIDHFKRFNDEHGHEAGDLVLKGVAKVLKADVRESDIAARWGGEEFLVVLPEVSIEIAAKRAEALRAGMVKLKIPYDGKELPAVTISLGVSVIPDHGLTLDDSLVVADAALYRAKKEGRNRVVVAERIKERPAEPWERR